MDSALYPEGVRRCSPKVFFLWTLPWLGLLAWGGLSAFLCLWKGLNQTNMSDTFAFALQPIIPGGFPGALAFAMGAVGLVIGPTFGNYGRFCKTARHHKDSLLSD